MSSARNLAYFCKAVTTIILSVLSPSGSFPFSCNSMTICYCVTLWHKSLSIKLGHYTGSSFNVCNESNVNLYC